MEIPRKFAPFLRTVVIPTDFFSSKQFWQIGSATRQFWSSTKVTTTLMICGTVGKGSSNDQSRSIARLWETYKEESCPNDRRRRRIKKAIYANIVVHSDVFQCPPASQVVFQTVLYHCILKPPVIDIFNCEGRDDEVNEYIVSPVGLVLKVAGPESFILKETDVQKRIRIASSTGRFMAYT